MTKTIGSNVAKGREEGRAPAHRMAGVLTANPIAASPTTVNSAPQAAAPLKAARTPTGRVAHAVVQAAARQNAMPRGFDEDDCMTSPS